MGMLPYLTENKNPSKKYTVSFRGLNMGEGTQDGEFAETYNLSTDKYPCITQRAARVKEGTYTDATTIHAKDGLLVIAGTEVSYDGKPVGTVEPGRKQTATVGNYIVIFPDKVYYKVPAEEGKAGEFGTMEETYTNEESKAKLTFTHNSITIDKDAKDEFKFGKGDAVIIAGCKENGNNKESAIIIQGVSTDKKTLTFHDNSFAAGEDDGVVTIKRNVPALEFICESNYRLWGTKGNTIYSSKFSDPLNFEVFEGLASDSYYIDVGSDGEFTGCIPYSSHICFFKENTVHKLYGSKPSNFQITTANVYGVQKGCERSMHVVNEQLLYKGVDGVYAYTGGVPELISSQFGTNRYFDAVASCDGSRYYISMKDQRGVWGLYVYDVLRDLWLREDGTQAVDMVFHEGKVFFVDEKGVLYSIDQTADRSDMEWGATFCTIHETVNEKKVYSKFHLRMDLCPGAWVAVDMKTDNDLQWRQVYSTHNSQTLKTKTVSIPILPTRCDRIDVRLRGKGLCTLRTFIREYRTGSDA